MFLDNTYSLLRNSLHLIQNEQFILTFKEQFMENILITNQEYLKMLQSHLNPLVHLITIDQEQEGKKQLVKDLIGIALSLIEITKEEVLRDTFSHPSTQTFTYSILFNQTLNSYPIFATAIHYLSAQWEEWTAARLRGKDVDNWKHLSKGEQNLVRKIWSIALRNCTEEDSINALFDTNERDMQIKVELKEAIVMCLNCYCKDAIDRFVYQREIQKWQKSFEEEFIQSIQMSHTLHKLQPFARTLNPYRNVHTWRTFLQQKIFIRGNFLYHLTIQSFHFFQELNIELNLHRNPNQVFNK